MKDNLIVINTLPMTEKQKLSFESQAKDTDTVFIYRKPKELDKETVQSANIIIGNVSPRLIEASPNLMWLQLNSAGADGYLREGALHKNTMLTNASGAYGLAISEHMLGMLLSIQKKLYLYRDNQLSSIWKDEGNVTSIENSTTLVIGLGDIGGTFAQKMKALGSYTIGVKRNPSEKPDYLDELHLIKDLDSLLPNADIVALSLPGNEETSGIMTKERLLSMKKSAILLNVGRGSAIDTNALCEVLNDGHLLGAGLDVTDPEPLPPNHPLWTIKNAVITPHISGLFHLQETLDRIIQISTRNFSRFLAGNSLENQVDYKTGYRKATPQ